jgi:hypothetical protein
MTQEQLNEIMAETRKRMNNMPKDVLNNLVKGNTSYFRDRLRGQYLDTATNDDIDWLVRLEREGLNGDIDCDMMDDLNGLYQRAIDPNIHNNDDQDAFVEWVQDLRMGH